MGLDPDTLRRYARHIALPEIGESGQLRLSTRSLRHPVEADAAALEWATRYLERAGVGASKAHDAVTLPVPAKREVERIAGHPDAYPVAAMLAGAFAAVEAVKGALEVGRPGDLADFSLSGEPR